MGQDFDLPDGWGKVNGVPYNPLCGTCKPLAARVMELEQERTVSVAYWEAVESMAIVEHDILASKLKIAEEALEALKALVEHILAKRSREQRDVFEPGMSDDYNISDDWFVAAIKATKEEDRE